MKNIWMIPFITLLYTIIVSGQTKIDFEKEQVGHAPRGFSQALTGQGKPGVWVVAKDEAVPSQGLVLAQTDPDNTSYRFPVVVYDGVNVKDATISVKFKPIRGQRDQAAGIVWRYRDQNNYYIVRANALENNVVLYKVEGGKRSDLPLKGEGRTYGKKIPVPAGQWSTLTVTTQGNLFQVFLNDQKLYEVEDNTFPGPGRVGLWTKADSVTYFDDLQIQAR